MRSDYPEKKSVPKWVMAVVVTIVIAFGLVYAILPADNLKAFIGMEDSQAAAENSWNTLTPSQQDALAPLLKEWNGMSAAQKKKWLEVAKKADNMSPEDKERFKTHIQDWLNLTPEQRRQARQNFIGFKKLNPQLKTEQWQEYQKLPEEKKRALAARAKSKRRLANLTGEPSSNKVVEPIKQPEKTLNNQPAQEEVPEYWR